MPETEPTDAERGTLARAITRAHGLAEKGRADPVVAAIMEGDEVVAWADDEVHLENDPSRRAPIVAIAAACGQQGRPRLKNHTLVTTLQPCAMCLGAMVASGISRVVFAARQEDVRDGYFGFPGFVLQDFADASRDGLDWAGGVMENDVRRLYTDTAEDA